MSLVLILGNSDRIVAVSDSRRWFTDGLPPPAGKLLRYQDDENKIRAKGRFMVGAVGEACSLVWPTWDTLPIVTGETAPQQLDRLVAALAGQKVVAKSAVITTVAMFGHAAIPDGAIVRVRCEPGGKLEVVARVQSDHFPIIGALGWEELPFETIQQQLAPQMLGRPSEAEMVTMARETITDVGQKTDKVGGPIHIAVIDVMGARWIPQ